MAHPKKHKARQAAREPEPPARTDRRVYLWGLAIVAAVFVAYIPVYDAGFIWDDDDYILLNPLLTEEGGLAEIWNPRGARNPQYYPLVFTTFYLEHSLWGLEPLGYHIVNVMLHAANAALLLVLLRKLGVPGGWLVAALFALHPVCVESVAWVTERKNVLAGLFYFLAALSYLRFDATSRYRWFGVTLLCFVLALFSKTVTASLPVALGLILWWKRRPLSASRIATLVLMLAMGYAMGMITKSHEYRHMAAEGSVLDQLTFPDRILIAGRAFWFYPYKILWPAELAFMHDRWDVATGPAWQWLFPLAGLAAAVTLLVLLWRGKIGRGPVAAALFYAVTIFPALGFVNIVFMRFSPVADHFQYLAGIGTLLLVVGAATRLIDTGSEPARSIRIKVGGAAALGVLCLLGWTSYRQAGIYHDLDTLWADTAKKSPENYMVQVNYGVCLKRQGDNAGAAECFERAIRYSAPGREGVLLGQSNLASIRYLEGEYEQARDLAEGALAVDPDFALALLNKGRALWRLGRLEEAEATVKSLLAMDADPNTGRATWDMRRRMGDAGVWQVLAKVQDQRGDVDGAIESYSRAIECDPTLVVLHHGRMEALTRWRRYREAIAAARVAIKQFRDNTPFRLQLAWLLAAAPDAADRDGEQALALARDLVSQLGDQDPLALSLLAAAQAELGQFQQAEATARRALEIAQRANATNLLGRLQAQAVNYAQGQPLFEPP